MKRPTIKRVRVVRQLRSDFSLLSDSASWIDPNNLQARNAFTVAMANKAYGYEALHDAWSWFLTGWNSVE